MTPKECQHNFQEVEKKINCSRKKCGLVYSVQLLVIASLTCRHSALIPIDVEHATTCHFNTFVHHLFSSVNKLFAKRNQFDLRQLQRIPILVISINAKRVQTNLQFNSIIFFFFFVRPHWNEAAAIHHQFVSDKKTSFNNVSEMLISFICSDLCFHISIFLAQQFLTNIFFVVVENIDSIFWFSFARNTSGY